MLTVGLMAALENIPHLNTAMTVKDEVYVDPAEYVFQHTECHDVVFNVGRDVDKTETITAVKFDLLTHSSVFRQLLADSKPHTEVRISDVSPQVFKLMLRHMYGGEIPPCDPPTAIQLASAADIYNIRPLVTRVCKLIVPKSAADMFPALVCVTNVSCPDLEPHVTKIVQEQTKEVLSSEYFLDLDAKCMEFISRQEKLSVTELELWRALVHWAQHKAATSSDKTPRQHLQSTLAYVRLLTFSPMQISNEVVQTKILTSDEVVELLTAVTGKQDCKLSGFCSTGKERKLHGNVTIFCSRVFNIAVTSEGNCYASGHRYRIVEQETCTHSNLSIKTSKKITMIKFFIQSQLITDSNFMYKLSCSVTVSKLEDGFILDSQVLKIEGSVLNNTLVPLPLNLENGQPLVLEADGSYNFNLEFSSPHSVYNMVGKGFTDNVTNKVMESGYILVQHIMPFHVRKIEYFV